MLNADCVRSHAALAAGVLLLASVAAASPPATLRDSGLYAPGSDAIAADVLPFSPQYPLWSDGAAKRRWIRLPAGTAIDAAQAGAWQFPVGTQLWKEFSVDGRAVETRLIERLADGEWRYATYVWDEDGGDARLAPEYGIAALPLPGGGRYAVPSQYDCRACHDGAPVPVLGFSALQLSADRDPLAPHAEPRAADEPDLQALVERDWLINLPPALLDTPPRIDAPTPRTRAVLGYLHGNCGHCHARAATTDAAVPVELELALDPLDAQAGAQVLRGLLDATARYRLPGATATRLLQPGDAGASLLPARLRSRDPRVQMPPLGTAEPDPEALALIERWIHEDLSHLTESLR